MVGVTPLNPDTIRESFAVIREIVQGSDHPHAVELVNTLERRLILDESVLAMQARLDEATDLHSVHVDRYDEFQRRTAARQRFLCEPDESCRDGEPSDDEIYFPSYVGTDGPTEAA